MFGGGIFRLSGVFCVDSAIFCPKILAGGRCWAKANPARLRQVFKFFLNYVLDQNRPPGGLLGRKIAESTQKTPENLKIRPEPPSKQQENTNYTSLN